MRKLKHIFSLLFYKKTFIFICKYYALKTFIIALRIILIANQIKYLKLFM